MPAPVVDVDDDDLLVERLHPTAVNATTTNGTHQRRNAIGPPPRPSAAPSLTHEPKMRHSHPECGTRCRIFGVA
jgi:hypothetical protein